MNQIRSHNRLAAVCAALTVLSLLVGCGSAKDAPSSPAASDDGGADNSKLADSLPALIDRMLETAQKRLDSGGSGAPSQAQMDILRRAKDSGEVSKADYEAAWSNFRQCVVAKGQPEPKLMHYSNGLYSRTGVRGTEEQRKAFSQATTECEYSEVIDVQAIYAAQVDNPSLYADPNTSIVDCLHRHDVVPKDYTVAQFSKEEAKGKYSFDEWSADASSCFITNNYMRMNADDPSTYQDLDQ